MQGPVIHKDWSIEKLLDQIDDDLGSAEIQDIWSDYNAPPEEHEGGCCPRGHEGERGWTGRRSDGSHDDLCI